MDSEERQRIYEEELVRVQARKNIRRQHVAESMKYEAKRVAIAAVVAAISAVGVYYLITDSVPYFINHLVSTGMHSIPAVKH